MAHCNYNGPIGSAAPSGTVGADVRCSASGCNRPATWRRQSWVRNMRDQPVCDDHVGFYRACGLACTPIRTPNAGHEARRQQKQEGGQQ